MRQIIRLTEGDIHRLVVEVVNNVLNQGSNSLSSDAVKRLVYDITGVMLGESRLVEETVNGVEDYDDDTGVEPNYQSSDAWEDIERQNSRTNSVRKNSKEGEAQNQYIQNLINQDMSRNKPRGTRKMSDEEMSKYELLKKTVIYLYEGYSPEEISWILRVSRVKLFNLIKEAYVKFSGENEFTHPGDKNLRKKDTRFVSSVMKEAWKEVRKKIGKVGLKRFFGMTNTDFEKMYRNDISNQLARGQKHVIGDTDETGKPIDEIPAQESDITPEFKQKIEDLVVKHLGDKFKADAVMEYYSGKKITDILQDFQQYGINMDYQMFRLNLMSYIDQLKNSAEFKKDLKVLLNGESINGKRQKVNPLNTPNKGLTYEKQVQMHDDYESLVYDVYSVLFNGHNIEDMVSIPENADYSRAGFVSLFTNQLIPNFNKRPPRVQKEIINSLRNQYNNSKFLNTWGRYIA